MSTLDRPYLARNLAVAVALLTVTLATRPVHATPRSRTCWIVAGTTAGATLLVVGAAYAASAGDMPARSLTLGVGGALALSAAASGTCFGQRATPRFLSVMTTAIAAGVGAWTLAGVLRRSASERDAFRSTASGFLLATAATLAGGIGAYALADGGAQQWWLTLAPLGGMLAGQLVIAGLGLRTLGQCRAPDDPDCDSAYNGYRFRRDALFSLGIASLAGAAIGVTGAGLTPTVQRTRSGSPIASVIGRF